MKTLNVGVTPLTRTGEPFIGPDQGPLRDLGAVLALMFYSRIPNDHQTLAAGRQAIRLLDILEHKDRPATIDLEDADYAFLVQRAELALPYMFGSVHSVVLVDLLCAS